MTPGVFAGSRPRHNGSISPLCDIAPDALTDFAVRLGFETPATQCLCLGDKDAQARLDEAERATAEIAAAERASVHNTEMELLWIQYDPEYALYRDALELLKAQSAESPDSYRYLVRKPGWLDGIDTFNVKPVADPAKPFAEFNDRDEDVIAVARGGVVLACKK